jgi:hypothetical protein
MSKDRLWFDMPVLSKDEGLTTNGFLYKPKLANRACRSGLSREFQPNRVKPLLRNDVIAYRRLRRSRRVFSPGKTGNRDFLGNLF